MYFAQWMRYTDIAYKDTIMAHCAKDMIDDALILGVLYTYIS